MTGFLERALAYFAGHGITATRGQTDNAWTYTQNRGLRELLARHGIQHRRIPPRTPKRNGKIERYQQTLAREWACRQRYRTSDTRAAALPIWAHPLQHHQTPQLDRQPAAPQPRPRSEGPEAERPRPPCQR